MDELRKIIRNLVLRNAVEHDGRSNVGPVLGQLMAADQGLRSRAKEVATLVGMMVGEVNRMAVSEQVRELEEADPGTFLNIENRRKERRDELPPLDGAEGGVVMRFAPGPSGPLHLGHTRAVILNDEYVKRYGGKLIIRLEDTNPDKIDPEAYESILNDLNWLGIDYHETAIQSDRFELYEKWGGRLVELGRAYVCSCDVERWRGLKEQGKPCPHRELHSDIQMKEWEKMLDGTYGANEAVLVVKTDLNHKNPAVRDFVAMRSNETPHPRTGCKYRVYPLYNFSVAIDDHFMKCTHILRGKDHLNNAIRQKYIYRYLGWDLPSFHHYGWVSIKDVLLKTSTIKEGIVNGEYKGWDDMRLGTLQTMARRGIKPEAIRAYWKEVGTKPVDVQFSWENLFAYNKSVVEKEAKRYFFARDPARLYIEGIDNLEGKAPLLPDRKESGYRITSLDADGGPICILVDRQDAAEMSERLVGDGSVKIRLKDLCNVEVTGLEDDVFSAKYAGTELNWLREGARIIHWVPSDPRKNLDCTVLKPDGSSESGKVEAHVKDAFGELVQFERCGFVSVNLVEGMVEACFAHK